MRRATDEEHWPHETCRLVSATQKSCTSDSGGFPWQDGPSRNSFNFWKYPTHILVARYQQRYDRLHVRSCETCATTKPNLHPRVPPAQLTDTAAAPFEKLGVDLIGPFDLSTWGNRFSLVVHYHFSKFTQSEPLPNKEAQTALERMLLLLGLRTRTRFWQRHRVCKHRPTPLKTFPKTHILFMFNIKS